MNRVLLAVGKSEDITARWRFGLIGALTMSEKLDDEKLDDEKLDDEKLDDEKPVIDRVIEYRQWLQDSSLRVVNSRAPSLDTEDHAIRTYLETSLGVMHLADSSLQSSKERALESNIDRGLKDKSAEAQNRAQRALETLEELQSLMAEDTWLEAMPCSTQHDHLY